MTDDPSPGVTPRAIDIERERGVTVSWEDDHVSRYDLTELRTYCPCAQCRGLRQSGEAAWPPAGGGDPPALRVESATPVGNWGLNIHWNDSHTTGIYTWEVLRSWCGCDECDHDG